MNLNDSIIITLTDNGVMLYKKYWEQWDNSGYYPGLEGNVLTIALWEFAQIFGQELYMANPTLPCETTFKFKL